MPFLVGAQLQQAIFIEADVSGANFSRCDLYQAQFPKAVARGAIFDSADLTYCDFSHADLSSADLSGTQLFRANFHRIQEEKSKWSGSSRELSLGTDAERAEAEDWPRAA
jgi:uncharacterized protein YjbI with pentapeptide repeats